MPMRPLKRLVTGVRKYRRRVKRDSRWAVLKYAGTRLLAEHDYDEISVKQIADEANCSVGAFYTRFESKEVFLKHLIRSTYERGITVARRELDVGHVRHSSPEAIVKVLARNVVDSHCGDAAGIARVAIKLGRTDPEARKPYLAYRLAVTDLAVERLKPHVLLDKPEREIREAMQIILGAAADTMLHGQGPLLSGSDALAATLDSLLSLQLKLNTTWPDAPVGHPNKISVQTKGLEKSDERPVRKFSHRLNRRFV